MTLLVSAIAVISLLVGRVGVMNIMLVLVTERVAEIGLRMAVGAHRQDILQQFLIEAALVCLLGIGTALSYGVIFNALSSNFTLIFSASSIALAFSCSCLIGLVFGFLPARSASRLDPAVRLPETDIGTGAIRLRHSCGAFWRSRYFGVTDTRAKK